MLRQIIIISSIVSLSACSILYKQPISQGNIISTTAANGIHRGMRVAQVVNKIGYPVMTNMYPENRLVYVYSLKEGFKPLKSQRLIITFRNKRVSRIQRS